MAGTSLQPVLFVTVNVVQDKVEEGICFEAAEYPSESEQTATLPVSVNGCILEDREMCRDVMVCESI